MAIKWDKEKIILSTIGSIVALVLGYLIWRHEQTVQQTEDAQNLQAQQNIAAQQASAIEQELESLPQYTAGASSDEDTNDTGSTTLETPTSDDDTIAQILSAFFPSTATTTSTGATTTSTPATTTTSTTPITAPPPPTTPSASPVVPVTTSVIPTATITSSPSPILNANPGAGLSRQYISPLSTNIAVPITADDE